MAMVIKIILAAQFDFKRDVGAANLYRSPAFLPRKRRYVRTTLALDGVSFRFLYPNSQYLHLDNNSSCVLRISVEKQHLLLTGDIERFAERFCEACSKMATCSSAYCPPSW